MRAALLLSFLAFAASALPAEESAGILSSVPQDPEKAQDKVFQDLEKAQKLYLDGLGQFQQGNIRAAKKSFKRSFNLLSSLVVEEGIGEKIRPEFQSLLEKIRSAEIGAESSVPLDPSALDVRPEEIAQAVPSKSVPQLDLKKYTIKVDPQDPLVQKLMTTYTVTRRDKVEEALGRSGRYRDLVMPLLKEFRLPRELFYLMMVESEYKIGAYSRVGAAGLWQIMPATARKLGLKVNYWIDERYDPEMATRAALKYLKELYELFDDWHLALAAYNRGEYGIGRDLQFARATDFSEPGMRSAVPRETEYFVPKFMTCALIGDNPAKYGFNPKYEKPEEYDVVEIPKSLDLKVAADCAGTTKEVIQQLNPAIRAWCTPINYPNFKLRIPKGSKEKFLAALAEVKNWTPSQGFVKHKVRSGEVLGAIAKKYKTTVNAIMEQNRIKNARHLRPGQVLTIQPGRGFLGQ